MTEECQRVVIFQLSRLAGDPSTVLGRLQLKNLRGIDAKLFEVKQGGEFPIPQ